MEHILYIMSVMNPPYGLNYSMYYWNHGLQRAARIEAVGVCFNGSEWECVEYWYKSLSGHPPIRILPCSFTTTSLPLHNGTINC